MTGCGVRNIEHFLGVQTVQARKGVSSPENAATADEIQYCMQAFEGVRTEKGASSLRTISKRFSKNHNAESRQKATGSSYCNHSQYLPVETRMLLH